VNIGTNDVMFNVLIQGDIHSNIPIIFLHGFTGSSQNWTEIISGIELPSICVDLPGHGKSKFHNLREPYSFQNWQEDFDQLTEAIGIETFHLCGYSMGGRLAISYAQAHHEKVAGLILESSTLGIDDEAERLNREVEDKWHASQILVNYESFLSKWGNLELFAKQQERNLQGFKNQKKIRESQDKVQLAHVLQELGTGKMPPYWDDVNNWEFPTLLITGNEDIKFSNIAQKVQGINPRISWERVPDSGHNIHLENPQSFIEILRNFQLEYNCSPSE